MNSRWIQIQVFRGLMVLGAFFVVSGCEGFWHWMRTRGVFWIETFCWTILSSVRHHRGCALPAGR